MQNLLWHFEFYILLSYFEGLLPRGASTKRDTVLEAGRGVRKLPVPVVKSSSSSGRGVNAVSGGSPTKFERMLLNRSFDEAAAAGPPREGGISRAADRVDHRQPVMRPMDIPVTSVGGLMPPQLPQPLPTGQVHILSTLKNDIKD